MINFAYHGFELKNDDGMIICRLAFTGIYSLLQHAPRDVHEIKIDVLKTLFDRILELNERGRTDPFELTLSSYLHSAMSCVLTNIAECEDNIESIVHEKIVPLLIQSFEVRQDVFEEGFQVYGGLCMVYGKEIYEKNYHEDFMKFINHGLNHEASSIVRSACSLLCDIMMNDCGMCLEGEVDAIAPRLLDMLKSPDMERTVKIMSISTTTGLMTLFPSRYVEHANLTMNIYKSAAKKCLDTDMKHADRDTEEYIKDLSRTLIETYTSIVQDIKNQSSEV